MFPLRDENSTVHAIVAIFAIIGINVAVWIGLQRLGSQPHLAESIVRHGLIPAELLGRVAEGTRVSLGPGIVFETGPPNWLSPLTSMFMHGGWFHLISNMWFLTVFGKNVEDAMGPLRFTVFYLVCGLLAAALQVGVNPSSAVPMVGASGAVGGVMAGYVLLYPRAPVHLLVFFGFFLTRIVVPAFVVLGYWFLLQILGALAAPGDGGGVAFWAHIGGFVAGLLLVRPFCKPKRLAQCRARRLR